MQYPLKGVFSVLQTLFDTNFDDIQICRYTFKLKSKISVDYNFVLCKSKIMSEPHAVIS